MIGYHIPVCRGNPCGCPFCHDFRKICGVSLQMGRNTSAKQANVVVQGRPRGSPLHFFSIFTLQMPQMPFLTSKTPLTRPCYAGSPFGIGSAVQNPDLRVLATVTPTVTGMVAPTGTIVAHAVCRMQRF
jgi:hypothetical protein